MAMDDTRTRRYTTPCPYAGCSGVVVLEMPACMEPGYLAACNTCGRRIVSEGPGWGERGRPIYQAVEKKEN